MQTSESCREIEAYLCRKNDGHLIRVVGPSFDLVASWAARGVPLKIAFEGIDRYFIRDYRNGPRRRPVRIDFCEDDVLDAFEEWQRATGVPRQTVEGDPADQPRARSISLPAHVERVLIRLTAARATGRMDSSFDPLIDRVGEELERIRAEARSLRGAVREQAVARLQELDHDLLAHARQSLDEGARSGIQQAAEGELAAFRAVMTADAFGRAREAAIDQLVRERLGLPVIAYHKA